MGRLPYGKWNTRCAHTHIRVLCCTAYWSRREHVHCVKTRVKRKEKPNSRICWWWAMGILHFSHVLIYPRPQSTHIKQVRGLISKIRTALNAVVMITLCWVKGRHWGCQNALFLLKCSIWGGKEHTDEDCYVTENGIYCAIDTNFAEWHFSHCSAKLRQHGS